MLLPSAYYPFRQLLDDSCLLFPEAGLMVDHLAILAGARFEGQKPNSNEARDALREVFSINDIDPTIADRLPYDEFFSAI